MNRKLPNLSCVMRTSSKAKPWKVERRTGRVEHVSVSPRLLSSRESFYVVNVGRFKHRWQAENAAIRSAQRHGGFAKDADGGLWPNRPIRAKESNSVISRTGQGEQGKHGVGRDEQAAGGSGVVDA